MDTAILASNDVAPQQFGDFLAARTRDPSSPQRSVVAVQYLQWLDPDGWHNLVALDPAGQSRPEGKTFAPYQWAEIAHWIERREGRLNLYFNVNEPRPSSPDKKLTDADIGKIRCICADVDPVQGQDLEAERTRIQLLADGLQSRQVPPTIIDSGGGYQFFWRLSEKLDPCASGRAARAQGRGIARAIGGDAVHDLARVMRLPGTTNIPDAKKIARGRKRAVAKIVSTSNGAYRLDELSRVYPPVTAASAPDKDDEIEKVRSSLNMDAVRASIDLADLDEAVRRRLEALLATDVRARKLWAGDASVLGKDKSGSAYRGALADVLGRAVGFTAQHYGEILHAWDYAVISGEDIDEVVTDRLIARDWVRVGLRFSPTRWLQPEDSAFGTENRITDARSAISFTPFAEIAGRALNRGGKPLIKGLLDCGTASMLYAPSNAGKTFVALDVAFHVAMGIPWNHMRVRQMAVVYLAMEGGLGVTRRAEALRRRYGLDKKTDIPLFFRVAPLDLLRPDGDVKALIAALDGVPNVGLVVIDTTSRALAGGDENSSVDMGVYVRNTDAIRTVTSAHVLNVHHTGKDAARGARGWSGLRAAIDTELEIVDGVFAATKQREMAMDVSIPFELDRVELGKDEDGDPITSCVVRWLPAEKAATPSSTRPASPKDIAIANVVLDQLNGRVEASWSTEMDGIIRRLVEAKLIRGKSRVPVSNKLKAAFLGSGVTLIRDGQSVCLRMSKGAGQRDLLIFHVQKVNYGSEQDALSDLFA